MWFFFVCSYFFWMRAFLPYYSFSCSYSKIYIVPSKDNRKSTWKKEKARFILFEIYRCEIESHLAFYTPPIFQPSRAFNLFLFVWVSWVVVVCAVVIQTKHLQTKITLSENEKYERLWNLSIEIINRLFLTKCDWLDAKPTTTLKSESVKNLKKDTNKGRKYSKMDISIHILFMLK